MLTYLLYLDVVLANLPENPEVQESDEVQDSDDVQALSAAMDRLLDLDRWPARMDSILDASEFLL